MRNFNGFKHTIMVLMILLMVAAKGFLLSMNREAELYQREQQLMWDWAKVSGLGFVGKKTCQRWAESSDCKKPLLRAARVFRGISILSAIPLLNSLLNPDCGINMMMRELLGHCSRVMVFDVAERDVKELYESF